MKTMLSAVTAATLVSAIFAQAETLFQTFDTDPLHGNWVKQESDSNYYGYRSPSVLGTTSGYLTVYQSRDDATTARYVVPIASLDKTAEFWMEFDIVNYQAGLYQNGNFGVFESSSATNEQNSIVDRHNYGEYTSFRANRHDLYAYDSTGTELKDLSPYIHNDPDIVSDCEYGDPQRIKMHYWYDAGTDQGLATLEVYKIDPDGTLGRLLYSNGSTAAVVIDSGQSLSVDRFGLGNRTNGSQVNSAYNYNRVDNLYFSTDTPNLSPVAPDFFAEPDTEEFYVAPAAQGDGSGSSRANAASYLDASFWADIKTFLTAEHVIVCFLDGQYQSDLTLVDIGNETHRLTVRGDSNDGVIFSSAYFGLHGVENCTFERIHLRGSRDGYAHSVTSGSHNVLVQDCTWKDLTIKYGASGVKSGAHHVTFRSCRFERVGPSGGEHMLYNAYDAHHISLIDCWFEDCTGDYVRFRDHTDCAEVVGCTFKSTSPGYNRRFIAMPLYNDVDPGDEYFGTYYRFVDNIFDYYPGSGTRVAVSFYHYGYDPVGYNNLMTADEGEVLENGTSEQKKQLLWNNCGIDCNQVRVMGNSYDDVIIKGEFGSHAAYGAISKGWEGWVPIFDLFNHTDPVITRCENCLIGDFNNDYTVNFGDFAILASRWQMVNPPVNPSADIAPLAGDNSINYDDLRAFVIGWLNNMN